MLLPFSESGSASDTLVIKVFHSYRRGLVRCAENQAQFVPRNYDTFVFLGTIGWLPPKGRLQLRKLSIACGNGLTAARQGRLEESTLQYEKAKNHLDEMANYTRLGWLLGASIYEAGIAYLDFKCRRVLSAIDRLDRAMDADLELELKGLPVMQMNRIQQGHNLARLDFKLGRRESAIDLVGMLLAYLERQADTLPFHHSWRPRSLRAVSCDILKAMIHQIIGETVSLMADGGASAAEWHRLVYASRLVSEPEKAIFPQIQYALRAQSALITNDFESYLQNLECFFCPGIRHVHLLWYALMVGFMDFCREAETQHSRQVSEVIARDSLKWRGLPVFLRDRFQSARAQSALA